MSKRRKTITNGVAWLAQDNLPLFGGHAALYRISPGVCAHGGGGAVEWVIAYSVSPDCLKPETIIYPANEEGKVIRWEELEGSYVNGIDHQKALGQLGFTNIQKHSKFVDLKRKLELEHI